MSAQKSSSGYRNAYCSFCRKSYRDVGPLVEGPDQVYICAACIDLCRDIIDQEKARRSSNDPGAYFRSKVEHMLDEMESMKWNMEQQLPPLFGQYPPKGDLDRLVQVLREMKERLTSVSAP